MRRILAAVFLCAGGWGSPGPAISEEANPLAAYEKSVFSQAGEDGVIQRIFTLIEPRTKFAVEFGAGNGVRNSNMRNLVVNHGWATLQIEGNPHRYRELEKNYAKYPTTKTLRAWIWPGNIETLFEDNGVPTDLDYLVIDIDSNDYYVWKVIHDFRPAVVQIEYSSLFPPPKRAVIAYHPFNYWDGSTYAGASMQSLYELGKRKGYELVYANGINMIFVESQYFDRFAISDNSPARFFTPYEGKMDPGAPTLEFEGGKIQKKWIEGR